MGQCNKCRLQNIRSRAKEYKQKVTVLPSSPSRSLGLGGYDVYVHPYSMTPPQVKNMTKAQHERYFSAWFMKIGKTCECD